MVLGQAQVSSNILHYKQKEKKSKRRNIIVDLAW